MNEQTITLNQYVGGRVFDKIQTDHRVVPGLDHCIFCDVRDVPTYRIPLDCIKGDAMKQCPACKRIYVLTDPVS